MNKCNTERENHYEYEDFILGRKLSFLEREKENGRNYQCFIVQDFWKLPSKSAII